MKFFKFLPLLFLSFLFVQDAYGQCGCTNCPVSLPDNSSQDFFVNISGANNNDLATNNSVTGITLIFNHQYLGDLQIMATSPDGDVITLVGAIDFFGPTDFTSWNVTFVESTATAVPDAGIASTWSNGESWGTNGTYTGSYYPYSGSLEDFNSGSVNGTWVFSVTDDQGADVGDFIDFQISFANEASATSGTGVIGCSSNPPCDLTSIDVNIGGCTDPSGTEDVSDDIFTITADLVFTDASSTDLTFDGAAMTDLGGGSYSINLPADEALNPAIFQLGDGSGTCTVDFTDFNSPASCSPITCDADPGTFTDNFGTFNLICNQGDDTGVTEGIINTNNDYNTAPADPCGALNAGSTPGVIYILYSDVPTQEDWTTDPNFVTTIGTQPAGGAVTITQNIEYGTGPLSFGSTPNDAATNYNTTYYVGVGYLFEENDPNALISAINYDCAAAAPDCGPVASLTSFAPFAVLAPISITNVTAVCNADLSATVTFDVAGGIPAYVAATGNNPAGNDQFTLTNNGTGTLSVATTGNATTVTISNVTGAYDIAVADANGCSQNASGFWLMPTIDLAATATKVCEFDADCSTVNTVDLTGVITPQLGTFNLAWSPDNFPSESSYAIQNSAGATVANGGQSNAITTGGLDPTDTYTITFFDSFGDGWSCGTASIAVTDTDSGANLLSLTQADWSGTSCGDTNNSNYANGDGGTFGPFPLGSPTPYIDPIGALTGPGVADNGDNTGVFNASTAGPGVHTISLDYTTGGGCILHEEVIITVCANPATPVAAATNPAPVCDGDATALSVVDNSVAAADADATTADIQTYEWYADAAGSPDLAGGIIATGATYDPGNTFDYTNTNPESVVVHVRAVTFSDNGTVCYGCFTSITLTKDLGCCDVAITSTVATAENCFGANDGTLTINATTSNPPVMYSINGGAFQASNIFSSLAPGTYTILVQDAVGATCQASTTDVVAPGIVCGFQISDPCSCLDNSTPFNMDTNAGGDDGEFSELVAITGPNAAALPAGFTFTIVAGTTGAFDAYNVPTVGTPGAGVPVATDGSVALTYNAANGHYELPFVHVDDIGYTVFIEGPGAFGTPGNLTFSISNKCAYPNPTIVEPALSLYCPDAAAVTLSGAEANGAANVFFFIDANPTPVVSFDPSTLTLGAHTVTMVYDGIDNTDGNNGLSPDGGTTAAVPGCIQPVVKTVVVDDTEDPNAVCQNATIQLSATGNVTLLTTDVDGGSTDNCNIATLAVAPSAFTCANVGDNVVVLTVTDINDNVSTCNATVTVEDNVAPDCQTMNITVQLDATGNTTITTTDVNNASSDACGIASLAVAPNAFTCANVGDNVVVLTATDVNNNTSNCNATVTVEDNVAPDCQKMDITVQLDVDGNATIVGTDVDGGSSDACGIASLAVAPNAFTCTEVGDNTVTLTVTDVNGNTSACDATVAVEDNIAPDCQTMDIEVFLDENGEVSITPASIDNNSTDACGIATSTINISDFTCASVGPNTVTLTLTDVNDNTSSCNAEVTVTDAIPPSILCRQPILTCMDLGLCGAYITLLDPFADDNCGVGSITNDGPADSFFEGGTTILTWTVTDVNGNTSSCEQQVSVYDDQAPIVSSCSSAVVFDQNGNCQATVMISVDSDDNCGIASVTNNGIFNYPIGGIFPHEIVITDVNGLVTTHTVMVATHDEFAPEATVCPEDVTVTSSTELTSVSLPNPVFTDNCGVTGVWNDAPDQFPVGTTTVTWTASDNYGLTGNCVYDVNVAQPLLFINNLSERIEACVENTNDKALVSWNEPDTETVCESCPTTEYEDFVYLADFYGHQYFLYVGQDSLSWADAQAVAEAELNAHLVTIDNFKENNFLKSHLPQGASNIWIGLNINQDEEGTINYAWTNDAGLSYNNLGEITELQDANAVVAIDQNGNWTLTDALEERAFIVERPCITLTQTGPIIQVENEEGELTDVLLQSGDEWPLGEYVATYRAENMCGDVLIRDFDVLVDEPRADYCATAGADTEVWIQKTVFEGLETAENNTDSGYADYSETVIEIAELMPVDENGDMIELSNIQVSLQAGGNTAEEVLYWNLWLDLNNDGDFFDANELVVHTSSNGAIDIELPIELFGEDEIRSRVSVSRFDYPEVCADYFSGEVEDYSFAYNPTTNHDDTIDLRDDNDGSTVLTSDQVKLIPNPATSFTYIHTPALAQEGTIKVLDTSGKLVASIQLNANATTHRLDVSTLAQGLYFIEITNDQTLIRKKLLVGK